jgi:hypothetical protein
MKKITLKEIFHFHGILISMMLHPCTGKLFTSYWEKTWTYSFTSVMTLKRFQQIRSCLRFKSASKNNDSLYKIRPILNLLKKTIGAYTTIGSDVSLDEAKFSSRSSFGRPLIIFNAKKPTGKFHYKMYSICCPYTSAMLSAARIQVPCSVFVLPHETA